MTNTPVTQIIEELDKRIAQVKSAIESLPSWSKESKSRLDCLLEELQNQRKYALTMLPVEEKQKENDYSEGCDYGINAPHPDTEYGFAEYFKSQYKQYQK